MLGIFYNCGQVCTAGSRIYVHESIYENFVEGFISRAEKIKVGNQMDSATEMGPIIDEIQFKRVLQYIETGKSEGAKLAFGGKSIGETGYFIEPTVFVNCDEHMTIVKEEIFGPVACINSNNIQALLNLKMWMMLFARLMILNTD